MIKYTNSVSNTNMAILNHDYYGKPNKCPAFFLRDSGEPAPHPEINNLKKKICYLFLDLGLLSIELVEKEKSLCLEYLTVFFC